MTALALGGLGVVVPLLPTTPFVLLAAFAFSKSSDRWHAWLIHHPVFGPLIDNWNRHGAISLRAKVIAILSLLAVLLVSWLMKVPVFVIGIQILVLSLVALFILSRPLPPDQSHR